MLWMAAPAGAATVPAHLRVCDDESEYPPMVYLRREGNRKTDEVIGYSIDYLREILTATQRSFSIDLLPWQRCLNAITAGEYDLALSASRNPERETLYLFTPNYYSIHQVLYYSRTRPKPLLDSPAALRRLRLCGQSGYYYGGYGIEDAIVDRGARTLETAVEMLRLGRCDVLMGDAEVTEGQSLIQGRDIMPASEFGIEFPAYALPDDETMIIGRVLPYAQELQALLSAGIADMTRSGRGAELAKKYFKGGKF